MRTSVRVAIAIVALVAALGFAQASGGVANPKLNAARRLLAKLKLVDGEGSGLDADTVRGKTFDDAGGFQVVDSAGHTLGNFAGDYSGPYNASYFNAIRRQAGMVLGFRVSRGGFANDGAIFYHDTTDCSGPRYVVADAIRWVQITATDASGTPTAGYYMGDPIQFHTFVTSESTGGGYCSGTPSAPGFCCEPTPNGIPFEGDAGPAVSFDLSQFTPPFHVE